MHFSTRTVSITVASVLAASMIALSFWFSGPLTTKKATAEGFEELLAAYAKQDADADGLPDWQESLYGTDPKNPHSVDATLTDGEAVAQGLVKPKFESQTPPEEVDPETLPGEAPAPQSVTDTFARAFLEQYLQSTGGQPMAELEQRAFVTFLMGDLSEKVAATLVSKYTITSVSQSQNVSVLTYVDNVERMLAAYRIPPDAANFLLLSQAYIEHGDQAARAKLLLQAQMYENLTAASLRLSVPPSLASAHLQMLRSFDTLGRMIRTVAAYEEDPLPVLGALSLYTPAGYDSLTAMRAMVAAAKAHGGADGEKPGTTLLYTIGESL